MPCLALSGLACGDIIGKVVFDGGNHIQRCYLFFFHTNNLQLLSYLFQLPLILFYMFIRGLAGLGCKVTSTDGGASTWASLCKFVFKC